MSLMMEARTAYRSEIHTRGFFLLLCRLWVARFTASATDLAAKANALQASISASSSARGSSGAPSAAGNFSCMRRISHKFSSCGRSWRGPAVMCPTCTARTVASPAEFLECAPAGAHSSRPSSKWTDFRRLQNFLSSTGFGAGGPKGANGTVSSACSSSSLSDSPADPNGGTDFGIGPVQLFSNTILPLGPSANSAFRCGRMPSW